MSEHLPECPKSGCEACYEQGQRDALLAAREAVGAALSHEDYCKGQYNLLLGIRKNCKCSRFDALAAIDALRKDNDD